jgi:hypothetical protein
VKWCWAKILRQCLFAFRWLCWSDMEHGHAFWQCVQCTQHSVCRKLANTDITQYADTAITVQSTQQLLYSPRYKFETRPGHIIFLPRFSWFPQSLMINAAVLTQSRPRRPRFKFFPNPCSSLDAAKSGILVCGALTGFRVMPPPYEVSRSHSMDKPHSVSLLWTSDQPDAEVWHSIGKNVIA